MESMSHSFGSQEKRRVLIPSVVFSVRLVVFIGGGLLLFLAEISQKSRYSLNPCVLDF